MHYSLTHQKRIVLQFLGDVPQQPLECGEAAAQRVPAHLELEVGQQQVARLGLEGKPKS